MHTKTGYSLLTIKAIDDEAREITGIATTPEVDSDGDIVEVNGLEYKLPMPFLRGHDHNQPIGEVYWAKKTKEGLEIKARIAKIDAPSQLSARLTESWELIKSGLMRGLSIGFRPLEYSVLEDTGGYRFTKARLHEISAVVIPANYSGQITSAKQLKAVDTDNRAALGKHVGDEGFNSPSGVSEKKTVKLSKTSKEDKMNIAEQIKALHAERAAKVAEMEGILSKSAETGETPDEQADDQVDTINLEIESIDKNLKQLETLKRLKETKLTPVSDVDTTEKGTQTRVAAVVRPAPLEKGIEFAQYALCLAAARGNLTQAVEIAKSRYPNNKDINLTLKAAVEAGTTLDSTWAAPLVDSYQRFAGDFVEYLRPQTILGRFGTNGVPSLRRVPFNISIPTQTSGGAGYWVGEGAPKPLTQFAFDTINLRWAKVANIAVITEELARFSNPSAEAIVRDQLAAAIRERLDIDFVDPAKNAVTNISPASITNTAPTITSSGNTADDVRCDIKALFDLFIAANNIPTNGVWIMSTSTALALSLMMNPLGQPEFPSVTMTGGVLWGLPVITSEYVPSDSTGSLVILVNASDIFLSDDGQVAIDASREASLQMLDPSVSGAGAPTNNSATPTPTTLVSMFQTNSIAIRAERYINWAKRRASSVAVLDGVNWGACGS